MTIHPMSVEIGENISRDAPIRLDVAAKIAFPDGTMGAAGLRKERDKGNLVTEMIAGKEYVTLAEIERMRERCRVQRKAPDLSGARKAGRLTDHSAARLDGSLKTEDGESRRDALKAHLKKLKDSLPTTSRKNTSRSESGTVIPIK